MNASLKAAYLIGIMVSQVAAAAELTEQQVQAMEQKCETAREAKLKPLRDAEIARCKSERGTDPDYCERYFRNYGDSMRSANGTMTPRMFHDLPECVAALKARQELAR